MTRLRVSKKLPFLVVCFVILGAFLLVGFSNFFSKTEAAWFDDNFSYRKLVPIATHTAAESNVYITFEIDANTLRNEGKLRTNCQDIRVTDADGNLLDYHVGRTNACGGTNTTIDAVVPVMPAGAQYYYVYYGNPGAESRDIGPLSQSICGNSCTTNPTLGSEETASAPVAYWKFDLGTGTIAGDNSTNGNKGTLSGATLPTWQNPEFCISDNCLYFGGSTSYVNVANSTSLNPSAMTISAWVKANANSGDYEIISKQYGTSTNVSFTMKLNSGVLQFTVCNTAATCVSAIDPSGALPTNNWYFLTGTYDGSTAKLYKNGNLIDDTSGSITIGYDSDPIFIGARSIDSTTSTPDFAFFNGFIDEPKIYNYARSASQIRVDYNTVSAGTSKGNSTVLGAQSDLTISQGLLGYWNLDESSGNAADSSGNSLTLTNNSSTAFTTAKFYRGAVADGAADYFSTATTISGVKTVAFWLNSASTTEGLINLTASAYISGNSGILSATGFTNPKIYVNGKSESGYSTGWLHVVVTSDTAINANQFEVMRANGSFSASGSDFDEVRLYNRFFSPADVENLYTFGPGPIGYWNLEEGSGTTAYDVSGNSKTATITSGNGSYGQGKYGKGYRFDNSTTKMETSSTYQTPVALTIEAWVLPKSIGEGNQGYIFSVNSGAFRFYFESSQAMQFRYPWSTGASLQRSATNVFSLNVWNHVAVTYDGTLSANKPTFYVNGVVVANGTDFSDNSGTISQQTAVWTLGNNASGANTFDGLMDEFRVYNYVRTPTQIIEDMNAGHPIGGSPVASQIGYWKLDEGYGTAPNDSSGHGATGTMGNFTTPPSATSGWSNAGKFNKALNYDGTTASPDDSLNLSTVATTLYDNLPQLTASAWINPRSLGEGSNARIFDKTTGTAPVAGWNLALTATNALAFKVDNDPGANLEVTTVDNVFSFNSWQYVAVTWDGSNTAKNVHIYVNGVETPYATQTNGAASRVDDAAAALRLGNDSTNAKTFDGWMDEAKIYNAVLTPAQILTDYNRGQAINFGVLGISSDGKTASNSAASAYCVPGSTETCSPPILEWKFEQGLGSSATDTSGNDLTGTLQNSPTWSTGAIGKGLTFNKRLSQYVSNSSSLLGFTSGPFTLSSWFNVPPPVAINDAYRIISKWQDFTHIPYELSVSNDAAGDVACLVYDGGYQAAVDSRKNYGDGKWHFAECVVTSSQVLLYVDGTLGGVASHDNTFPSATADFQVGAASAAPNYMKGSLDEVRVFNYARTASQVAYDYNRGMPTSWWKADECQGLTLKDSVGTGSATITIGPLGSQTAVGTCQGSAGQAWKDGAVGKYNYSLNLDGTDDYVQVLGPQQLMDQQGSVAMWVKPAESGNYFGVTDKDTSFANFFILTATTGTTCDLELNINRTGGTQSVIHGTATGHSCPNGSWAHLVITGDGSSYQWYLNGQPLKTAATAGSNNGKWFGYLTGADNLSIGTDIESNAVNNPMGGQYDDIRVYNYPLTPTQVKMLYNQNSAVRFGPQTGAP